MGIFNRDYMRGDPGRLNPAHWSAIGILLVLNVVVFLAWQVATSSNALGPFLRDHFVTSWQHLLAGRVWTLLTSVFSHYKLLHLLFNMIVLYMFGSSLEALYGRRRFIIFYCLAGVCASLVHCLLVPAGWPSTGALGASGSMMAAVMTVTLLDPRRVILLFGLLPMPMWLMAGLLVAWDIVGLAREYGVAAQVGGIANGAHLGGALFGTLYFLADARGLLPGFLTGGAGRGRRRRVSPRASSLPLPDGADPRAPRRTPEEEARMDRLLAKVSSGGLDSLTSDERDFLLDMSRRMRR